MDGAAVGTGDEPGPGAGRGGWPVTGASRPELTGRDIYTDPKLLDVAGAVDALPDLGHERSLGERGRA